MKKVTKIPGKFLQIKKIRSKIAGQISQKKRLYKIAKHHRKTECDGLHKSRKKRNWSKGGQDRQNLITPHGRPCRLRAKK